jgi:hypothetical protein
MESLGRFLILTGILIALAGAGLYLASRSGVPLGRLPGDIRFELHGIRFYLPVATSIVVSLILTVVLNVVLRIFHK